MKFMISLLMVFMLTGTGHALDLVEPEEYEFNDAVIHFNGEGKTQLSAIGTCYGPYYAIVNARGAKIGGLLSSCGLVGVNTSGAEDKSSALVGIRLAEFFGMSLSVGYDPITNDPFWGFGLSMMDIGQRLSND